MSSGVSVQGVSDRGVCAPGVSIWGEHIQGVMSCHRLGNWTNGFAVFRLCDDHYTQIDYSYIFYKD